MTAAIEAHELSKWFGEVIALNNVTLTIPEGVTGLLGANGAGKSTFIKLCLGLYAPSRGSIKVLGAPPRNNPRVLRRIGYCPEIDNFYDSMTGFEFVYWLCRFAGFDANAAEKKAEEAMERVGMAERMDDLIETYSKGMRQRTKLAQAIALNPEVLFLDEPMNGLDPQGREHMYSLIRELGDEGRTVIVSSHILYEIERVTDSVVLMFNATLLAQGRVKEIRDLIDEYPHTIFVDSPHSRRIALAMAGEPSIRSVEFDGETVTFRTHDPNRFYHTLNELVAGEQITVRELYCTDDNLQSVFDYLIKR